MTDKILLTHYLTHQSKSLGNLLGKVSRLKQWNTWLAECLVTDPEVAHHCHIVNYDKASLIIVADNAHWITRFRFHIPELLPKLRGYPELKNVKALCCKVHPNYGKSDLHKKNQEKISISQNSANTLIKAAHEIKDKKISAILEKIALNVKK